MPETNIAISQIIRNYTTNLPVFPPREAGPAAVHCFFLDFYHRFQAAAQACGIAETAQPQVLERAQKTLWAFGRFGRLGEDSAGPALVLDRAAVQAQLKFPRAEETLSLLGALGAQVEYGAGGDWSPVGKLKTCEAARLRFPQQPALAAALAQLVSAILAGSPKEKAAFERFLRANPQAVLAREVPPLAIAPDAPEILANLPPGAAAAWQDLAAFMGGFSTYRPMVEFRSIQHGLWTVNYDSRKGGRDLGGLIVQNSLMTVRIILFGKMHFLVQERLDEFGDPVRAEYYKATWYEEFQHKWLFIPCTCIEDTLGIKKLLTMITG